MRWVAQRRREVKGEKDGQDGHAQQGAKAGAFAAVPKEQKRERAQKRQEAHARNPQPTGVRME